VAAGPGHNFATADRQASPGETENGFTGEVFLATAIGATAVMEPGGERRARRAAAYRAALRHSRWVRFFKWLIPVGSGLATLAILLVMIFDPFRKLPPGLDIAAVGLNGSKIVMEAPRLQGYRSDGRPFQVNAKAAAQDIKTPNIIELTDIDAQIALGEDGQARMQSPEGLLDSQKETLDLRQSVRVQTDTGYDVRLRSASIAFKAGHVRSDEPVSVTMRDGSIDADSLEIVEGGKQMIFSGRVRSVLTPRDPAAGAAQPSGPEGNRK